MKNYFKPAISFLAIALLSTFFFACNEVESDVTKPTITLNSPLDGDTLYVGTVHFDMDIEDNVALGSYKIEIHSNFDGHSHSKSDTTDSTTVDFSFSAVYDDCEGLVNSHVHMHDIVIPSNVTPGAYHLMVYCTDQAGNEAYVATSIYISNTESDDDDDDDDHDH